MRGKKGFTLIELLAVIVILAVIALIATPIIMNIINDARKGAMGENKRVMEHAAELFSIDTKNESRLPQNNGDRTYVDLEELENHYMKPIVGYGDKCEGYVTIDKKKTRYDYTAYLDCGDGNALSIASAYVNYGGRYLDEFRDSITTKDKGIVVVGSSNSPHYGKLKNKSSSVSSDAVIVKYNAAGEVEWENHFGGSENDDFISVVETSDGYIALSNASSKDGDLSGLSTSQNKVVLVKYSKTGKLLKKVLVTAENSNTSGFQVISKDDIIYVVGSTRESPNKMQCAMVAAFSNQLEMKWKKLYGGTYISNFAAIQISEDNQLLVAGYSSSTDGDVADIKVSAKGVPDGIIYKIKATDGTILKKTLVPQSSFSYVDIVGDNYLVRYGSSIYLVDQAGTILKQKVASNITAIKRLNGNNWFYSTWYTDRNGKSHIVLNTLDASLNVLKSKDYVTTDTTMVNSITELNNDYYIVGTSYSLSDIFENFNYGNSDAYLMKLDSNFELLKDFKLKTLLKQKLPELVKNYGDHIPTASERESLQIYTTNDPTTDLKKWCTSDSNLDPNANYVAPNCLKPFDTTQTVTLVNLPLKSGMSPNISLMIPNYQSSSWLQGYFYFGNAGISLELSNLALTFEDGKTLTVSEAVNQGYVEPLVISGWIKNGNYHFSHSEQLLTGGTSGIGNYASYSFKFKPKNKKLTSMAVVMNEIPTATTSYAAIYVYEHRHFDMSIQAAKDL